MSLEETILNLTKYVIGLSHEVKTLSGLMIIAQGSTSWEDEIAEGIRTAALSGEISASQKVFMEDRGYGLIPKIEDSVDEEPPMDSIPMESDPELKVQGVNPKEMDLINLSKELGYPFLRNEDRLIVDNRVLDEYNRRSLEG